MARKSVDAWLSDLREGNAKKMVAAARRLAEIDPASARAPLLEQLSSTPVTNKEARKALSRCLHLVADTGVVRRIAAEPDLTVAPESLPTGALVELYAELASELPSLGLRQANARLAQLKILAPGASSCGRVDDEETWKEARLRMLVAVLDDARLVRHHLAASSALRRLDMRSADRVLLERFASAPERVLGFSAYVAWLRLGRPVFFEGASPSEDPQRLIGLLAAALGKGSVPADELYPLGELLTTTVDVVPDALVAPLARVLGDSLPNAVAPLARRVVAACGRRLDPLVAIVDDERLAACWPAAFDAILALSVAPARIPGEVVGNRVLARATRATQSSLRAALTRVSAAQAYDLAATQLDDAPALRAALLDVPSALRDTRWLDLAATRATSWGHRFVIAVARDPDHPARESALALLMADVTRAGTEVIGRRAALTALGETGHPNAMPMLLAAMHDPGIGSAMALTLTAISQCAELDAIPILERQRGGYWDTHIESAIAAIRQRASALSRKLVIATCDDEDPVLAALARRARDGEADALVVLEDALRERGRLVT